MSINQRRLIELAKFGQEMSKYRRTVGVSAQALSDIMGYDRITLYRWERGKFTPSLAAAKAWADSLGLELTIGLRPRRHLDDSQKEKREKERVGTRERFADGVKEKTAMLSNVLA